MPVTAAVRRSKWWHAVHAMQAELIVLCRSHLVTTDKIVLCRSQLETADKFAAYTAMPSHTMHAVPQTVTHLGSLCRVAGNTAQPQQRLLSAAVLQLVC